MDATPRIPGQAGIPARLRRFGLHRATLFRDGRFSTQALSSGQRRRLALLISDMEDRPLQLYDEWAADQDPEFRDFFYRVYLPEQQKRGNSVIAVTHDDRYFDCADRVIRIAGGVAEADPAPPA